MSESGPRAIVLDVVGTCFSLDALAPPFAATGLAPSALHAWLAETHRDGFAVSMSDAYAPFVDTAYEALATMLQREGLEAPPERIAEVTQAFSMLTPFPDLRSTLERAVAAGIATVCLSNGPGQSTEEMLARAGLDDMVTAVLSAEHAQRWKPHPDAYRLALEAVEADAEDVVAVSSHPWDIHGAASAGLRTAWVRRAPGYPSTLHPPDVIGDGLDDALGQVLAPSVRA